MSLASLLIVTAAAALLLAVAPRLLLRWYLREIRRMHVPEASGEAIATYPLA